MVYNIFLCITFILQIFAAVTALRLIRVTRLNVTWILISAGLVTMSVRSTINIIALFVPGFGFSSSTPYSWGGIFVTFCFAIGVFFIQKIFYSLRLAEAKQRELEKRLLIAVISAEEKERKRFATELHDGLGPLLSSIKMGFSAISTNIQDDDIRKNLELAIAEAIVTVREVSNNLSPHVLNNFGIQQAIRNFLGKLTLPVGFDVSYDITIGDNRYESTKEIVMYRVFCELLNNTLKHANATEVYFTVFESDGNICLTYTDNGVGFDPERIQENGKAGNGYYNIISRVSSLKGTSLFRKLNGEQGTGLYVEIKIPANDR